VVANDADGQRCNLLTHQTKRMCSPCLMITNHSGEMFPRMLDPAAGPADGDAEPAAEAAEAEAAGEEEGGGAGDGEGEEAAAAAGAGGGRRRRAKPARLLFDRILADVPCSGE
jgi:16S rRNA C967 or C1407 C5-methylase (RsmB/RsmF family)